MVMMICLTCTRGRTGEIAAKEVVAPAIAAAHKL